MGMSGEEIVDRFFGQSVALVIFKPGEEDPGLVVTKVSDADAAVAIQRLHLKQVEAFGEGGAFRVFKSQENESRIAIGKGWAVVARPEYAAAAKAVLEGRGKSLADLPAFREWTARLPEGKRSATAFIRAADDNVHVLGAYRKGRDVTFHYRGKSPQYADLLAHVGDGKALDFGPLPASTIAAVNLNLRLPEALDTKQLDRMFPGKTFRKDIQPKLGAPAVAFLGEVPGDKLEPGLGFALPVTGVALKLKDPKVADDLNLAINSLLILANFAAAKWELPMIEVKEHRHGETTFRAANIGAAIAKRAGRDEFKPVSVSYGRVGDWYIICTQEQFFTQCIDAAADPSKSFAASQAVTAMPLKEHEGAIATAVLKPAALAAHLESWLGHWKGVYPDVFKSAAQTEPPTPEAQLIRGGQILAGLLDHYQSMTLQAYRDGDGIAAQADVVRK
jgi:hypothetical protein